VWTDFSASPAAQLRMTIIGTFRQILLKFKKYGLDLAVSPGSPNVGIFARF
jgi:hypothetical protein